MRSKKSHSGFSVRYIRLNAIEVPSNRRQLDEDKLKALDASVDLLGGLRTPITVREKIDKESGEKKYLLEAGAYRVEVANRRGCETIPSFVVRRKVKARLWREAENLYRAELNVLERAESIEKVRAAAFREGGKVAPPGGRQPHDVGINKTARRLGFKKEEIRRAKCIAAISAAAKAEIWAQRLENNQRALLKIADIADPQEQLEAARAIGESKKAPRTTDVVSKKKQPNDQVGKGRKRKGSQSDRVADLLNNALEPIISPTTVPEDDLDIPDYLRRGPQTDAEEGFAALKKAWAASTEMRQAWDIAPTEARNRFIAVVLEGRVK